MRRNLKTVPELPCGAHLLAVAYGSGKDDYLAYVLGYISEKDEYVTWIWNSCPGCEGFGEGHYLRRDSYTVDTAVEEAAWLDFTSRAKSLTMKAWAWKKEGLLE